MIIVHEIKSTDAPQSNQFCNWMLKNVHSGLIHTKLLFIIDGSMLLKQLCKFSEGYFQQDSAAAHTDVI
jgi:hypothetical protein